MGAKNGPLEKLEMGKAISRIIFPFLPLNLFTKHAFYWL